MAYEKKAASAIDNLRGGGGRRIRIRKDHLGQLGMKMKKNEGEEQQLLV